MNLVLQSEMVSASVFDDMISAAVCAPSADNNQPWRFETLGAQLQVYLNPLYLLSSDVKFMFDLIAIGAAIENGCIAAMNRGYMTIVDWTFNPDDPFGVPAAVINLQLQEFSPLNERPKPSLYAAIEKRCTCRKLYSNATLPRELLDQLSNYVDPIADVKLEWITERTRINEIGKLVARADQLRFETQEFHNELVRQLRFSRCEVETSCDGLDVSTLELPPGGVTLLRCFTSWSFAKFLKTSRLMWMMTMPSALAVRRSGALAVISVKNCDSSSFLNGGRAIQRLWLAATHHELSVQPLGSLPIFLGQATFCNRDVNSECVKLKEKFANVVPSCNDRVVQLILRCGNYRSPTARSLRRKSGLMPDHEIGKKHDRS